MLPVRFGRARELKYVSISSPLERKTCGQIMKIQIRKRAGEPTIRTPVRKPLLSIHRDPYRADR